MNGRDMGINSIRMHMMMTRHKKLVVPWLVVTWKHPQMTPPNKFFVVKTQKWIIRIQEFRMKNHFNPVFSFVVQVYFSDLVKDRVMAVVCHIVCHNGW